MDGVDFEELLQNMSEDELEAFKAQLVDLGLGDVELTPEALSAAFGTALAGDEEFNKTQQIIQDQIKEDGQPFSQEELDELEENLQFNVALATAEAEELLEIRKEELEELEDTEIPIPSKDGILKRDKLCSREISHDKTKRLSYRAESRRAVSGIRFGLTPAQMNTAKTWEKDQEECMKGLQVKADNKTVNLEEVKNLAKAAENAKKEADAKAEKEKQKAEQEKKAQEEKIAAAKKAADEKAKLEAEHKAKLEAEQKAKLEAERKAKLEAEQKAKQEAERKAKLEAEQIAKLEAERKAKLEAERKAKLEAEQKAEKERQAKAAAEAEEQREKERQARTRQEKEAAEKSRKELEAKNAATAKARKEAQEAKEAAEKIRKEKEAQEAKEAAEKIRKEKEAQEAKEAAEKIRKEKEAQATKEAKDAEEAENSRKEMEANAPKEKDYKTEKEVKEDKKGTNKKIEHGGDELIKTAQKEKLHALQAAKALLAPKQTKKSNAKEGTSSDIVHPHSKPPANAKTASSEIIASKNPPTPKKSKVRKSLREVVLKETRPYCNAGAKCTNDEPEHWVKFQHTVNPYGAQNIQSVSDKERKRLTQKQKDESLRLLHQWRAEQQKRLAESGQKPKLPKKNKSAKRKKASPPPERKVTTPKPKKKGFFRLFSKDK